MPYLLEGSVALSKSLKLPSLQGKVGLHQPRAWNPIPDLSAPPQEYRAAHYDPQAGISLYHYFPNCVPRGTGVSQPSVPLGQPQGT